MLARQQTPDAVIEHSRKVAELAGQIAHALAAAGAAIDSELVRASGLLHDLAKGQPKHAETGASLLRGLGMPAVAEIVAAHMEMQFDGTLDERAIVYLADKLAAGDRLVTLDERFRRKLHRFRKDREALQAAQRRKAVAEQISAAIEARTGMPLMAILREDLLGARDPMIARAANPVEEEI